MQNIDEKPPSLLNHLSVAFRKHKANRNGGETTFIWHIKNLEMCPDQWGKPLKSPEFSIYNWQSPKFHLMLYAGGVNEKTAQYLSLYIVKTNNNYVEDCTCSVKLGIITSEEKKTFFESSKKLEAGNGLGTAKFLERDTLQSTKKDIFLPDGNLTIFCEIKLCKFNESISRFIISQLEELSDAYENIYNDEKDCEVFLHVGENTFKAHRAILEARFPDLLRNMDGNKCKIKNIGSITMNAVLHYIYTGILNINEINLFEILSSDYLLPTHFKYLLLEKHGKTEVTTCFNKKILTFTWDIKNFSSLDSSTVIHYPLIGDFNIKWTWFDLYLSLTMDEEEKEYITISIQRYSKECKRIICTMRAPSESKSFVHLYNKEDKWILPNVFSKDVLKSTDFDETLNQISLNFELVVSDGSKTSEVEKKQLILNAHFMTETAEDLNSLKKDLVNMLNNPKFCDITLTSGKDKIPAHKFILSARSSVFRDMLQSESLKKKNPEITLDDVESTVIKDLLYYMYCNEVKFSLSDSKHNHKAYIAASKYNLPDMKAECLKILKPSLTAETAGDILLSAHKSNDEELKELVYNYVCTHPLEIANCKEWEQVMLKRSDLATEVLKKTLAYLAAKN